MFKIIDNQIHIGSTHFDLEDVGNGETQATIDLNQTQSLHIVPQEYPKGLYLDLRIDSDFPEGWINDSDLYLWIDDGILEFRWEIIVLDINLPSEISRSGFFAGFYDIVKEINSELELGSFEYQDNGELIYTFQFAASEIDMLSLIENTRFNIEAILAKNIERYQHLTYQNTSHKALTTFLRQQLAELKEIVEKCKGYENAKVDLNRLICFLLQFDNAKQAEIVIRLLKKIDFFDSEMINYLLKSAYNDVKDHFKSTALHIPLGKSQDSSSVIGYRFFKTIFANEEETVLKTSELSGLGKKLDERSEISSLIFIDDNITSGTQLRDFFEELIRGKEFPEMIDYPLTESQLAKLKSIPIFICYSIRLTEDSYTIDKELSDKHGLNIRVVTKKCDFNNYLDYSGGIMRSVAESEFAQGFLLKIAKKLYEDKEWNKETLYNRLLGYGNLGKLTLFYYNVPKSFLPVFWKYGEYHFRKWIPLFPEIREKTKIETDNANFHSYIQAIARDVVNND